MVLLHLLACHSGKVSDLVRDSAIEGPDTADTAQIETSETGEVIETQCCNSHIPLTDGYSTFALAHNPPPQFDVAFTINQFWRTNAAPVISTEYLPDFLGDCKGWTYNINDPQENRIWDRTLQSAGLLTLTGPPATLELHPDPSWELVYYEEFDPNAFPFGTSWTVQAEGAGFPAFDLPNIIRLPEDVLVTAPTLDFELEDGPLEIEWEGGDPDLSLTIRVAAIDTQGGDRGHVICEVLNEGHFTIDASFIEPLPSGIATVQVEHLRRKTVQISDRLVRFEGLVTTLKTGTR